MRLFEATRWAPSSFNAQQWRALYARRGTRALADESAALVWQHRSELSVSEFEEGDH